jgi:hypothetical protein
VAGAVCCDGCAVCVASGVPACGLGCESVACCAAALSETSNAAVKIQFEVRMTLLSTFF